MASNRPEVSEYPDGPWSVAQGSYEGSAILVRINTGAQSVRGVAALRHRIGVAVPLKAPDADGFPGADEAARLNRLEDVLSTALRVGADAVQLLTITTSGVREFVLHTTMPQAVAEAIESVRAQFPDYDVQCIQADDPDWDVYAQFVE